jgi:putative transposase
MARRSVFVHDQTSAIFRPEHHRLSATSQRHARADASGLWNGYAAELAA